MNRKAPRLLHYKCSGVNGSQMVQCSKIIISRFPCIENNVQQGRKVEMLLTEGEPKRLLDREPRGRFRCSHESLAQSAAARPCAAAAADWAGPGVLISALLLGWQGLATECTPASQGAA